MTGPSDLYKFKALMIPWDVTSLEDLSAKITLGGPWETSWHDGDTFTGMVSKGMGGYELMRIRTAGCNAPELHGTTLQAAEAALAFAQSLADSGAIVYLDSLAFEKSDEQDHFGRMLAVVTLPNGNDFATEMIQSGNAVPDPASLRCSKYPTGVIPGLEHLSEAPQPR